MRLIDKATIEQHELLTVEEAAVLLRHKPSTIRGWIQDGKFPYVKLSRRVLIRRSDVEARIAASYVPATPLESKQEIHP